VSHDDLRVVLTRSLEARGVRSDVTAEVVGSLIQTSLRGVDSHGVELFPHYLRALDAGRINPDPDYHVEISGATASLDADHGFGHAAGAKAMSLAVSLARRHGAGVTVVRRSTHFGAAAYFGLSAADQGLIGVALTHADSLMLSYGGVRPFFGTNAVCVTAPCAGEGPVCLDMATTQISWNKVRRVAEAGASLSSGLASDSTGRPTRDPHAAAALLPIGLYKGFGLAMMVDVVCSLLTGMPYARQLTRMYADPIEQRRFLGHFFAALDVSRFVGAEVFSERLAEMVAELRREPAAVKDSAVRVPGDPEKAAEVDRRAAGVPIPAAVFAELVAAGARVGVELRPKPDAG
jgi:ureidoglycolate dehydrogenase (NAD+)